MTDVKLVLVQRYQIHGVGVEVQTSSDALCQLVHQCLFPYAVPALSRLDLKVELAEEKRDWLVPTQARRFLRYGPLRGFALDGWRYFTDYLSYLIIPPGARVIQGHISEETLRENGERFFVNLLLTVALFEALRHHGLFFLHAAALESPEPEGYLFPGNAYSGKTSLTLALIRQGFRYLSDDTVFLRPVPEGLEVLPWIRPFHIPSEVIPLYPELSHLAGRPDSFPGHSKKDLSPEECYPDQRLPRLLNPRWLFFPILTSEPESRAEPLTSAQALPLLLPQSLAVMFDRKLAPDHLQALKRLLSSARSFRLFSGADLKSDASRLREILDHARAIGENL